MFGLELEEGLFFFFLFLFLFFFLGRCEKEWKHAVDLAERHGVILVVALVIQCSRPLPLKKFLYLDFVSKSKIAKVWEVLQDRICECGRRCTEVGKGWDGMCSAK